MLHGLLQQLQLLGLIAITLVEIGVTVVYVNQIVRFRSGLDSNDTLRRMWSKSEQILFQRVPLSLVLSLLLSVGVFGSTRNLLLGILSIVGLDLSPATDFTVSVLGAAPATLASTGTYLVNGGDFPLSCAGATLAIIESWTIWHLLTLEHHAGVTMIILWTLVIAAVIVGVCMWSLKHIASRVTRTAPAPGGPYPWFITAALSALLIVLRVVDVLCVEYVRKNYREHGPLHYFGGVLAECAGIMVLIGCAFAGIVVTNRSIMTGVYHWQWRALLAPVALVVIESVVKYFDVGGYVQPESIARRIGHYIIRSAMYMAASYVGAGAYLIVLALAARKALSMEGDTDLILDDEDEEEELLEEYEV